MLELKAVRYETAIDRIGLAVALGSGMGGLIALLLALLGGGMSPIGLALILFTGIAVSAVAIVALGGPVWLLCHRTGRRGPFAAALAGAALGFVVFLAGQTYGFGLAGMPPADTATLTMRWLSGVATSATLALLTGGIALAMWRVAYRRADA